MEQVLDPPLPVQKTQPTQDASNTLEGIKIGEGLLPSTVTWLDWLVKRTRKSGKWRWQIWVTLSDVDISEELAKDARLATTHLRLQARTKYADPIKMTPKAWQVCLTAGWQAHSFLLSKFSGQ